MKLTPQQKNVIVSLLRDLGERQGELSRQSDYASGNLSEFLNPAKKKGCAAETWARLVAALEKMVNAPKRRDLLDRNPAIREALQEIQGWTEHTGTQEGSNPHPAESKSVFPPPAPLPLDAANYNMRAADTIMRNALALPGPRNLLVKGCVGSGRTSLLWRLRQLVEGAGRRVVLIDEYWLTATVHDLEGDADDPTALPIKVTRAVVRKLAADLTLDALKDIAERHTSPREMAEEVMDALEAAPHPDKEVFILIDEASAWPETLGAMGHVMAFLGQFQLQLLSRYKFPYKLVLVVPFTPAEETAVNMSLLETKSTTLVLLFLSQEEVVALASRWGVSVADAQRIHAHTLGHPRFTQMLLQMVRSGNAVDEACVCADRMDARFGWDVQTQRLKAMLAELMKDPNGEFDNLSPLLRKISGHADDPSAALPHLTRQEKTALKTIGALNGLDHEHALMPLICQWADIWIRTPGL
ncbi:hypothetical protein [Rhodospira trueperi]|uniref:AAA ATPase domain-containing protein n=1 Tax=Rhodospira trueperi TaxID=69960 RepID=A0A1G7HJX2_9PROT|nr:hypothetical protein [Rhodospira trueperi]SDF00574.1 hypothetical protein SAMN05421720_1226 [Rhodospira trueperi]